MKADPHWNSPYETPIRNAEFGGYYDNDGPSVAPFSNRQKTPRGVVVASSLFHAAAIVVLISALLSPSWFQYRLAGFGQTSALSANNVTLNIDVAMGIIGRLRVTVFGSGVATTNISLISNHFALGYITGGDAPQVEYDWIGMSVNCVRGSDCVVLSQDPSANHLNLVSPILNPVSCSQAQNNSNLPASGALDGSLVTAIPGSRVGEQWLYNTQCNVSQVTLGLLCVSIAFSLMTAVFLCGVATFAPRTATVAWMGGLDIIFTALSLIFGCIVLIYYGIRAAGSFDITTMYIRGFQLGSEFAVYRNGGGGYLGYCFALTAVGMALNVLGLVVRHICPYLVPARARASTKSRSVVVI